MENKTVPWNHWSISLNLLPQMAFLQLTTNRNSRGGCAGHMRLAGCDCSCGPVLPVDMMSHEYFHIRLCSSDLTSIVSEISLSAELRLRSCMCRAHATAEQMWTSHSLFLVLSPSDWIWRAVSLLRRCLYVYISLSPYVKAAQFEHNALTLEVIPPFRLNVSYFRISKRAFMDSWGFQIDSLTVWKWLL